jgi:uncharacterized protein YutE (UPF0331/DUF86 family)
MKDFSHIAGFRNLLAHEYETLDYTKMYNILTSHLGDVYYFIEKVESFIEHKAI